MEDLGNSTNLINILWNILPNNSRKHLFFPQVPRTFTKIDHIWSHKTSLDKLKRIQIIQSMFTDHSKIKLEANKRKVSGKSPNIWKPNNTLLNNQRVKGKLKSILPGEDVEQEISFTDDGNANGTTTLGDSLAVSYKTRPTLSIQFSSHAPWCLPK